MQKQQCHANVLLLLLILPSLDSVGNKSNIVLDRILSFTFLGRVLYSSICHFNKIST
jgi:hypothetical protein